MSPFDQQIKWRMFLNSTLVYPNLLDSWFRIHSLFGVVINKGWDAWLQHNTMIIKCVFSGKRKEQKWEEAQEFCSSLEPN